MIVYWLSFVVDKKDGRGPKFAGVVITTGTDIRSVIAKTWEKGLNPGGEIATVEFDLSPDDKPLPERFIDRLLSKEEALEAKEELTRLYHKEPL